MPDEHQGIDLHGFFTHWKKGQGDLRDLLAGLATQDSVDRLQADVSTLLDAMQKLTGAEMAVEQDVQVLVNQIAKNTSLEESAAQALALLTAQATALNTAIATLQAGQITPETITALQTAGAALVTSATDLQAAVPAATGTTPVTVPPVVVPPVVVAPPAGGTTQATTAGQTAGPQGSRRF
jgi:hypothetical protein